VTFIIVVALVGRRGNRGCDVCGQFNLVFSLISFALTRAAPVP
jgi:hypothetical protein